MENSVASFDLLFRLFTAWMLARHVPTAGSDESDVFEVVVGVFEVVVGGCRWF